MVNGCCLRYEPLSVGMELGFTVRVRVRNRI